VQLTFLVVSRADRGPREWGAQLRTRAASLGQRRRPVAAELQGLRPVHHALPAERHQLRLGVAPRAQPGRPRLHAAKIEQLRARLDDTAVRVADNHRRNLARGHGDHGFIGQRHVWPRLAEVDERTPLTDPGQRDQIGVTEPRAKFGGGELVLRAGRVSAEDRLKRIP
jgi:DNA-binding transcriptional regulator YbjK